MYFAVTESDLFYILYFSMLDVDIVGVEVEVEVEDIAEEDVVDHTPDQDLAQDLLIVSN